MRQTARVKTDPKVADSIFAKGRWRIDRRQAVGFAVTLKPAGCPFPFGEGVFVWTICGNPNVTARVFKKAEDIVIGKSVFVCIDGLREDVTQLFDSACSRKTVEALDRRHPPFTGAGLESNLIPTPSIINLSRRIGFRNREVSSVEAMNEKLSGPAANHA